MFECVLEGWLCWFGLVMWLLLVGMLLFGYVVVVLMVVLDVIDVIVLCL